MVERGISLDELQLPASLRALVPLTDSQKSSEFEQMQPAADTSDGYETYDYYWYGYVAPRDAATRYENGERVVYYITYAGRDDSGKETSSVGEVAYRVYGTMGGGEASWYACNEGGIPNARIVDVDVSWDVADLDLSATGTYYLDGALTDSVYTSDTVPRAQVFVQEPQSCTCGAGADAEEHAEGCPLHDENSCAEHVDGVEELGADEDVDAAIAEIEGDAAENTGEEASGEGDADAAAVGEAADAAAGDGGEDDEDGEAEADADEAEASECSCGAGDAPAREHAADCPSYVEPAPAGCHCAEDGGPIDAANFPWAHRSDCPCYSPAECMCREQVEVSVGQRGESGEYLGEETETVPGDYSHVHDPANTDCPLYGQEAVKVAKERNAFAAVEDAGEASINAAAADAGDGLSFSSYMAKDEATAVEAAQEEGQAPYAALGKIAVVEEERGVFETVVGVLQDAASAAVSLFAAKEAKAAAGAQDAVFKKFIQDNIPSSVSEGMTFCTYTNPQPEDKVVTSAAWVSYVNSVFLNRCGVDMEWADVPGGAGGMERQLVYEVGHGEYGCPCISCALERHLERLFRRTAALCARKSRVGRHDQAATRHRLERYSAEMGTGTGFEQGVHFRRQRQDHL